MGLSDLNWTDLKSFHRNNLAGDANCHFLCDLLTVKRIPARLDLFQGSVKDSNGTVSEAAAWGEEKQHKRRHRAKQEVSTLTWTVELSALKFAQHYLHTLYVHRHSHTHALRWQKKNVTTYEHMLWKTQGQEKELGRCIMGRQKVCLHSHCKQISRLMNLWWIQLWLWLQLNQRAYSRSGRTKVFKCSHIFSLFGRHPPQSPSTILSSLLYTSVLQEFLKKWPVREARHPRKHSLVWFWPTPQEPKNKKCDMAYIELKRKQSLPSLVTKKSKWNTTQWKEKHKTLFISEDRQEVDRRGRTQGEAL